MIHNTLAIFNDSKLEEVEAILFQSVLMPQGAKNQLERAIEDYRFLVSSLYAARGISQQVILFLLNPVSCTIVGVDEFLEKLEYWIQILEDENEQRMYAEVLRYSYYEEDELMCLRYTLIGILQELNEAKRTLKKSKNSQDILVKNKIPMQFNSEFDYYSHWMETYGSEFDKEDSVFNIVPNLKGKLTEVNHPYYNSFEVYCENYDVPTLNN